MKTWKSRNLGKVIPSFLISEFSILPYSQNRKLGFKNLGKKIPRFPRFPSFRPGQRKMPFFFIYWKLGIWNRNKQTLILVG